MSCLPFVRAFTLVCFILNLITQSHISAQPSVVTTTPGTTNCTNYILFGTVDTHGDTVVCDFEYGLTTSYGQSAPGHPQPVTSTGPTPIGSAILTLPPGTTYHVRMSSHSAKWGTVSGNDIVYTTCTPATAVSTLTELGISIYPNPVIDKLFIDAGTRHSDLKLSISDGDGRHARVNSAKAGDRYLFSMSSLPPGQYWLQLVMENKIVNVPLIKK